MSAQSQAVMRNRNVGSLTQVTSTSDMNYFSNGDYEVINIHTRDFTKLTPLSPGMPTGWGQTIIFERDKDHDYFDIDQIQVNAAAATLDGALVNQAYVEGAGYLLTLNPQYRITNSVLNSIVMPYEWQKLRHRLAWNETPEQYVQCDQDNYLADVNLLYRQAALTNGWRFVVDFDLGFHHWSKETLQLVIAFNIRPRFQFTLPTVGQIVFNNGAATNVTNASTMITNIFLIQNNIHINPSEREVEIDRVESGDGIFTLIRRFEYQQNTITAGSTTFDITLQSTGTHEALFFIFMPTELMSQTAYASNPLDWTWGVPDATRTIWTRTIGGNLYRRPDNFEIRSSNGNLIFPNQDVWFNAGNYIKRFFPRSFGVASVLVALFTEEPLAHNGIYGTYDLNTHGSRILRLNWPSGSSSSVGGTWTVTTIYMGPNWQQITSGAAVTSLP